MIEDCGLTALLIAPIFVLGLRQESALRLHLRGTNFQLKVWEALLKIPFGAVSSYSELASRIGEPRAARAVGTAVRPHPVAGLIPCPRVIRRLRGVSGY